jgi:hypothetical protein
MGTPPPSRAGIPSFEPESDITDTQQEESEPADPLLGSGKEIEWVDWLDEYRKMKEAKLRAESQQVQEQQQEDEQHRQQGMTDAEMMPPPPLPLFKGKGKARESGTFPCLYIRLRAERWQARFQTASDLPVLTRGLTIRLPRISMVDAALHLPKRPLGLKMICWISSAPLRLLRPCLTTGTRLFELQESARAKKLALSQRLTLGGVPSGTRSLRRTARNPTRIRRIVLECFKGARQRFL